MQPFSQKYFDFAWYFLNHIPTNEEYNNLIETFKTAIDQLQFGSPLNSKQIDILFKYSKFSDFSWGNGKSYPTSENLWDNRRIIDQGFQPPSYQSIDYLEFPNPDNPQGVPYPTIAKPQNKPLPQRTYTPYQCANLKLYEEELHNNIKSTDSINDLFKYHQLHSFSTYFD